jgi:pyridoxal 5'-phosphate synthase pdxT subunit
MRCSSIVAVRVGVLAVQGDVSEHIQAFQEALPLSGREGSVQPVRSSREVESCDALAIPGGESTTIGRLIQQNGLTRALKEYQGGIFATCAGMVLVARNVNDPRITPLNLVDIVVSRNAFGRQRESFEAEIAIQGLDRPFHAVFIRAPVVTETGRDVRVLARIPEGAVAVESGKHMAFSFHPELCGDHRLHIRFLEGLEP